MGYNLLNLWQASYLMTRRLLVAIAAAAALAMPVGAQGLRQVGNESYAMTIEELQPTSSGIRVKVLIENLTESKEVFLHHEANQLNAQDFFYLYAARQNLQTRKRDTFLLPVTPLGTMSADLFFPLEPGANPGLLVVGSPRPPFNQVAVALGAILKGDSAEDQAAPTSIVIGPARPSQVATALPIAAAPRSAGIQLSEAPAPGVAGTAPRSPPAPAATVRPRPVQAAAPKAPPVSQPPPTAGPSPVPAAKPASAAKPPPVMTRPRPDAPLQTGWIPVDEEPAPGSRAAPAEPPVMTRPRPDAPPQTGWIPVDEEPAAPAAQTAPPQVAPPGPPPVQIRTPPRALLPGPAPARPPASARATVPTPKPRVVFVPGTPGDRVIQVFSPPHISLGQNLVLRQGKPGKAGFGWARIYSEHPDVTIADIGRAATYPHQVWSDGRTSLYLRWAEDQKGAVILQVAGDLIVNAQWATYDELLFWLGQGRVYPRLVYQGAR